MKPRERSSRQGAQGLRRVALASLFCALGAGCYPPVLPMTTAPLPGSPAHGLEGTRLTDSWGLVAALPTGPDTGWVRGPVAGGSLSAALGTHYQLTVGGSVFAVGAEGDLILLRSLPLTIGLLHGLQLAPSASLTSCLPSPCHAVFSPGLAYDLEGGVLVELETSRLGAFSLTARAGYGAGVEFSDAASHVPGEVQIEATVSWRGRLGALRIEPAMALLLIAHPSGTGTDSLLPATTWAIVPTLSVSTDL